MSVLSTGMRLPLLLPTLQARSPFGCMLKRWQVPMAAAAVAGSRAWRSSEAAEQGRADGAGLVWLECRKWQRQQVWRDRQVMCTSFVRSLVAMSSQKQWFACLPAFRV